MKVYPYRLNNCIILRISGGGRIAWDGKPWKPGSTTARFILETDAIAFAYARNLQLVG